MAKEMTDRTDGPLQYADETQTEPSSLSDDELFDILGNDRRRYLIRVLLEADGPIQLDQLTDRVAALENDKVQTAVNSAERKRVYTALQQTHLPHLADVGILTYDKESRTVTPTDLMANIDIYLQVIGKRTLPYSLYYLGISILGGLVFGLSYVGVEPIVSLSRTILASVCIGMFGVTAFVHLFHIRRMRIDPGQLLQEAGTVISNDQIETGIGKVSQFRHPAFPYSLLGAVGAGVVAGLAMGLVFHYAMYMTPLIGSLYGLTTVQGGWIAHLGHSVLFSTIFVTAVAHTRLRRLVTARSESIALGTAYGILLWLTVEGIALPVVMGGAVRSQPMFLYLPLDGLAAHLIYGVVLGTMYATVAQFLARRA